MKSSSERSLGNGCAVFLPAGLLGALWLSARGSDPHGGIFIFFAAVAAFILALLWLIAMILGHGADARTEATGRERDDVGDSAASPEA